MQKLRPSLAEPLTFRKTVSAHLRWRRLVHKFTIPYVTLALFNYANIYIYKMLMFVLLSYYLKKNNIKKTVNYMLG